MLLCNTMKNIISLFILLLTITACSNPEELVGAQGSVMESAVSTMASPEMNDLATKTTPTNTPVSQINPSNNDSENNSNDNFCTLSNGQKVSDGWYGNGVGDNFCNQCKCMNSNLACTKMACLDAMDSKSTTELIELPLESMELPEAMAETMIDIANEMMQDTTAETSNSSVPDPCLKMAVNLRPMCYMMSQKSQEERLLMGQSFMSSSRDNTPPVLYNLLIDDFGAFNPRTSMMGPFKFSKSFVAGSKPTVFDEFGKVHDAGMPTEYENPTFEYKFPPGTELLSPITGIVDDISWQPTESYKQDDWELNLKPSRFSQWRVSIDHVVSLECDLNSKEVCTKPLLVNGQEIRVGMEIKAGDTIGYAGNWVDTSNSGMNERTEITVGKFASAGVFESYCPIMYLHESVKQDFRDSISSLMDTYEEWSGNTGLYNQSEMVEPGCSYEQINDEGNKTTIIK